MPFIQNNQPFACLNCSNEVPIHPSSSRNHCNICLYSQHVDINPGDRKNKCQGLMPPIGLEIKGDRIRIIQKCQKCGLTQKNITAPDDNPEKIVELSTKVV